MLSTIISILILGKYTGQVSALNSTFWVKKINYPEKSQLLIYLCIIYLGWSITVLSTLRLKWPSTKKSKSSPEWRRAAHCSRMASTQMEMVSRGVEAEKTCFSMRSRNLVISSRTQTKRDDILKSSASSSLAARLAQKALRNSTEDSRIPEKNTTAWRRTYVPVALSSFPPLKKNKIKMNLERDDNP